MDLDTQIKLLIDNAPQDGTTPRIVEAIAPAIKLLARKLRHKEYYILQSIDAEWVMTILSNRDHPDEEKRVIYAYPTLEDVSAGSGAEIDPQMIAVPIPITHILFQLIALEIDSIVFFETPGDLNTGIEIYRADIQNLIQLQLQQDNAVPNTSFPQQVPPDIA